MKNITSTKTNILLKALDIELKLLLEKDLENFRMMQAKNKTARTSQQIAA
ncbi:hypothetical protein [Mucilaginibacter xinganensis]|uniref:Uncharacterized protein n=1 Tax=Mucilaginibacter xinganensis TaxID=1234841 RepID=A0A223NVK6_9SPHI|nr:hypothetical protein [Mucilaginibacter xinganensis]ASU33704.1 hypothetical protein MuYL_1808 [Mucilaginibacter xinganensis]